MSSLDQAIFVVGLVVSELCLAVFCRTFVDLRRIDEAAERRSAAVRAPEVDSR
jgi:hypothetical protein